MTQIQNLRRKALESLYTGTCKVIEHKKIKDEVSGKTGFEDMLVIDEEPCRLSFKTSPAVAGIDAAKQIQVVKLFLSPDVTIKPGSKIIVTQNGITTAYTNSSRPMVYGSHQEINLELFERWA